jgi:hypothetical protein
MSAAGNRLHHRVQTCGAHLNFHFALARHGIWKRLKAGRMAQDIDNGSLHGLTSIGKI